MIKENVCRVSTHGNVCSAGNICHLPAWKNVSCCLTTPLTIASGGSSILPLVIH